MNIGTWKPSVNLTQTAPSFLQTSNYTPLIVLGQSGIVFPTLSSNTVLALDSNNRLVSSSSSLSDMSGVTQNQINIWNGTGLVTDDASFELGKNRTGSGNSYIDFHSSCNSDFDARIIKYAGSNGIMQIVNVGTGSLQLSTSNTERLRILSSGQIGINTQVPVAQLDINLSLIHI